MKPYTRSIIELFDGKRRFLIPLYQRQYTWRVEPQLDLLWEDLERAVKRLANDRTSLSPHFMGAIVIAQMKTFGKQVQAFEVIDGQQRLTTFQLLLSALRDVAAGNGSKYEYELQKYLLNDGIMEKPESERFKLWPSLLDRRAFVGIMDPLADLNAISPDPIDAEGVVRRTTIAYAYFKKKITEHVQQNDQFDEGRLETLFEALKEGLAIVSIELESSDDPQTIFETLNSRGVDLTPSDLMRNFIFQRAKGLGLIEASLAIDRLYEKHWMPLDRTFWSQSASRGRQSRPRLDWMLTDHLSMYLGDLVSVETLFENYRRWILNNHPFLGITEELEAITTTAAIEKRLFEKNKKDPIGAFGSFTDAFEVSTATPLIIYLAAQINITSELTRGLKALESYILRRDICGLTIKNYNRLFIGIIERLRLTDDNKVDALITFLSSRQSDIDRWPDDHEWRQAWLGRDQYKGARQPRLRYIYEALEQKKRSALNEDIEIKSALTVEHIMPQHWHETWPIPGFELLDDGVIDPAHVARHVEREGAINKLGNLTLLTHALNSSVSNGPYPIKMVAVKSHSSLALNRDLNAYDDWNEVTIADRGDKLFAAARDIWAAPERPDRFASEASNKSDVVTQQSVGLPPSGTRCRFTYAGKQYYGRMEGNLLLVEGMDGAFESFSAASKAITRTSRNGWTDWYLSDTHDGWILAADWRKQQRS
jgi:hypothetical protein